MTATAAPGVLKTRFAEAIGLLEQGVGEAYPAAALLYAEDGQVLLTATAGQALPETWFDLASLTKALCTSVLCMRLMAAGLLDLDGPVLGRATVRHLLCHASGLPAWLPLYQQAAPGPAGSRRAAMVELCRAQERSLEGERSVYSDLGFILLGELIESRAGRRLDDLFAEVARDLEAELAFRATDAAADPVLVPAARCAPTCAETPARERLLGMVHDDNARAMDGVAGHAGLFGTVAGVSVMAHALVDSYHGQSSPLAARLGVQPDTVRRFFEQCGVPGSTWGLGWDHPTPGQSSAGARWSPQGVGHLGFTGCSVWLDPEARRWAVLLTNRVAAPTAAAAAAAKSALKELRPRLHDALVGDEATQRTL